MDNPIKTFSHILASAFVLGALAFVGCGTSAPYGAGPGPAPDDPIVTPPAPEALPEPKVQYNIFAPRTEADLMARYQDGQFIGSEIVNYGYLIARTAQGFDPALFARHGLEVKSSFGANGGRYWHLYKEPDADGNAHLVETMRNLNGMDGLMYVEPELMSYTTAVEPAPITYDKPDTYVADGRQYGVLTTHTKKAWEAYGFGPHRPVVSHFDTGIRWNHEDFKDSEGKTLVRHAFSWYNTTAGANNALLTDLGSLDPINDPEPPDRLVTDPTLADGTDRNNGHGTGTASIMAAVGNNGKGVAGMCWQVDLVDYKVASDAGSGGNWAVYGSFWHLAKWKSQLVDADGAPSPTGSPRYPHTIPVILSMGGMQLGQFNADMVEMALEHGIVLVASSGNDYSLFPSWPGSLGGAIRVGAVNFQDRRMNFSNGGPDLSVVAPGYRNYTAGRAGDSTYVTNDGTSFAAPHVAGLVGYMLTFNPDLKADQIKTYLEQNADPIEGQTGHSATTGWGRINTYRTIGAVIADINNNATPPSNYVYTPVKVAVKSINGPRINGAKVYLYNCNQAGTIANYCNVGITGTSYVAMRDDKDAGVEEGVAWFNGLRPGYYRATATVEAIDLDNSRDGLVAASPVFEVRAGAAVPAMELTIDDDYEPLFIQTLLTAAGGSTDTVIRLYNADGVLIRMAEAIPIETLSAIMPKKPGTYYLRISPYSASYYGNYALWLGTTRKTSPAPGTYATPGTGGIQSTHATTLAAAQTIAIDDVLVYGNLSATTGSTTGHYYKFVIE